MSSMTQIVQCVPNFSEGRDLKKIEKIVEPFRAKDGVKLLDYQYDEAGCRNARPERPSTLSGDGLRTGVSTITAPASWSPYVAAVWIVTMPPRLCPTTTGGPGNPTAPG